MQEAPRSNRDKSLKYESFCFCMASGKEVRRSSFSFLGITGLHACRSQVEMAPSSPIH
jgi:hypothetical protein